MAATHQWSETNLVGVIVTDGITNINFGSVDDHDLVVATYPISRATNSFDKYIRCKFTDTWTEISNMLFWKSAGVYKTDETITGSANAVYATPSQTSNGDSLIPTSEGTALAINSAEGAATIVYGASGVSGYSSYIRLQTKTLVTTPSGAVNQKTFTFQYDET
jgi:hypothetical protein